MFNFKLRQLNSPFDDSAFFMRNVYRKRAMLLDCGRLGNIDHSEVLSIGDIFISHTHMDHFYGFDRIIRSSLMAQHELTVYGPEGIINNVDGKFRAYTWNLVDEYNFSIRVVELHQDGRYKIARFSTVNRFIPEFLDSDLTLGNYPPMFEPVNSFPVLDLGEEFQLEYEFFDHRIPSAGYRITEPTRHAVNEEKLATFGQKTGPWLGKLIKALKVEAFDMLIDVNGTEYNVAELNDKLIDIKAPQVVTYITDCAPIEANIDKAIRFARGSSLLIIESPFLPEDKEHAEKKQHLTLDLSKKIFFESGSEYVRFAHFAARYELDKQAFLSHLYEGMNSRVFTKNTL